VVSLRSHFFPWLHVLGLVPIVHTVSCVWLHWTVISTLGTGRIHSRGPKGCLTKLSV
jgi:hypothetical protein